MKKTNEADRQAIIKAASRAQTKADTREQLGVLLYDRLLNEVATGKHFREDGVAEIPLTVRFSLQQQAIDPVAKTQKQCTKVCWSSLGIDWLCLERCEVVVVTEDGQ